MGKCKKHKTYKAIRPPKCMCDDCWNMYLSKHPEAKKINDGLKKALKKFEDELAPKRPIATLTINVDVSKQTPWMLNKITTWVESVAETLQKDSEHFGKCRFRLMK